jgi:hypothetical protein
MGLTEKDFKTGLKEVCYLIGYPNPPKEQIQLFYRKLADYDLQDFKAACIDDDMIARLSRIRNLDYTVIRETIEKYQNERTLVDERRKRRDFEKQQRALLEDEKTPEAVKAFIRNIPGIPMENALNRNKKEG